jgi:hypothetical protein
VLVAALLSSLVHCSLLVEDEPSELRCSQEGLIGAPACDTGQLCVNGRCHACIEFEICSDGVDNDCNGEIDDRCRPESNGGAGGEGGKGSATGEAGNRTDSN